MIMSSRTQRILELLLRSERDLTAAEMAASVQASSRTVHRELAALEGWLAGQGLELQRKSGSGIRLRGDAADLEKLRRTVSASEAVAFSPEERQMYLLCSLLENNEPVKLFALASELNVAVPTVVGDLDELETWMGRFGIGLIRKRGYGIELAGLEERFRETIRQLIKRRLDDAELTAGGTERPPHPLDRELFELAGKSEMADVETVLWSWMENANVELSEHAYTDLLIRLSIALRRIRSKKTVGFEGANGAILKSEAESEAGAEAESEAKFIAKFEAKSEAEHETDGSQGSRDEAEALGLIGQLSERTGIAFPRPEIQYMLDLLRRIRLTDEELLQGDDLTLAETVRALVDSMQEATGAEYAKDRSLRDGLFSHLKLAIRRLEDGLRIRNPLLSQIQKNYGGLFRTVREAADRVLPRLKVPDEEIGFLVMHFGASLERLKQLQRPVRAIVVCASGIGSSKMLQSRLRKELPQLEIVDSASWYEASRLPKNAYDLVVSTIDLPLEPSEYIKVSPLLSPEEADRLRSFIQGTTLGPERSEVMPKEEPESVPQDGFAKLQSLKTTLDEIMRLVGRFRAIRLRDRGGGLAAVLEEACRREQEAGTLAGRPERIVERLLERERHGSQLLPDTSLALFHTRSPDIAQSSLSLYSLEVPIPMDTHPPSRLSRFLLMLAPQSLTKEGLEVLSEISAMLLDGRMVDLLEAGEEKAIRRYMTDHLKDYFRSITESE